VDWSGYDISTMLQTNHNIRTFTFFPSDNIMSEWEKSLGDSISSFLDIIKIRVFGREDAGKFTFRIVPIVTIKPVREPDLEAILDTLLQRIAGVSNTNLDRLKYFAVSPQSRQRLTQYCLSAALGHRFFQSVASLTDAGLRAAYDVEEAGRHYGPWLGKELAKVGESAFAALWNKPSSTTNTVRPSIEPVNLPEIVKDWTSDVLHEVSSNLATSEQPSYSEPSEF
jgi:hypothetical protein